MQRFPIVLAMALVVFGSLLAWSVQRDGGAVRVKDVRLVDETGGTLSALVYIPESATAGSPAPGILAIHGYINSRETQSGFAIEFARHGFVVLAPDQTGHGYSDPPAFANGFGGPAALEYLRGLPFVDSGRIGLEGHSMGGWAVQMAAASDPNGYASMVLEGSSTGTLGAPVGTRSTPRNLLLVFSRFDEFSAFMWGAAIPRDIVATEKLKTLFGVTGDVEPGRLYGDVAKGTARKLVMPPVTHPGDHISRQAIGAAVDWFETTLRPGEKPAAIAQTWFWKEAGTLIALIGLVALVFPLVGWLVTLPWFHGVILPVPEPLSIGRHTVVSAVLTCVVPALTFFPLQALADFILPANAYLPQQITNGVLLWAWGTGLVTLILFGIWYRRVPADLGGLGMPVERHIVIRAAAVALAACAILYLLAVSADYFLNVDFRFWVVAVKVMSPTQVGLFLVYLVPFTIFFLVLSLSLHTQLARYRSLALTMLANGAILCGGIALMLVVQYAPLLSGGTLALASQPLLSIVAFQFFPVLFVAGLISTFCFERTGSIYTGAFVNGILVTWYLVAGTATQAVPFWYLN